MNPPTLNFTLRTESDFNNKLYDCLSAEIQSQLPTDILLITANDHESNACYSYMKNVRRGDCILTTQDSHRCVDFGQFGDEDDQIVKVALMKCELRYFYEGEFVKDAAKILEPKVVLFVGTCGCASKKPKKVKLGDVVISSKLGTYDRKVMPDGTVDYCDAKMSEAVARLILHAADGWKPPLKDQGSLKVKVYRDAVMLNGSDLVDNCERQRVLVDYFRDALGLEMKGAGIYAAANDLKMEWAVVKGVSGFAGEDMTEPWQIFASTMAASVVYNMFKYSVVLEDWPHNKETQDAKERNVCCAEDAQMNNNQISQIIMRRCELFEKTIETAAQKKLEINKECAEDLKGGKATKIVDVAGPTTTVIASLACGITAAMSVPTFGAASFAAAFVAGGTLLVKIVDKRHQQASAKVVEEVLETATEKAQISSYLNCVVKDVAKELSRIFESQLFELERGKQVEILAECAVDLMLDLQKGDTFDRNTLLKKVLQDGHIKKKKILTRTKDIEWSAPNVFRKPGLRRMIFGKDGAEFKHFIKPNKAGKKCKYGYRAQFLEVKKCVSQNGEGETAATDETPSNEDTCEKLCKDCSSNYEICSSGQYFGESEIDSHYTEPQNKLYSYNPLHILIQCPKVLESFNQLQKEKPSLANFLKSKLRLPEDHLVRPVYRPHSPRKVSDLQKSDLTGSDFSHSDFTNSSLQHCHFIKCVMLFVKLGGAKMSGSKFCYTLISHSNLEKLKADHCEWSKTSLLYSNVKGAHLDFVKPSVGGNCLDGTNICDAITGNNRELNCNEELAQAKISASQFCYDTLVRGNNSVEMKVDDCEGTKTSLLHSNISDSQCLDPGEPSTSGNFSDETKISNAIPGNMGNLNYPTV